MKHIVNFLFEIGTLRYIKRSWVNFLCPQFQNVSEHILRVIWIAYLIAEEEGIKNKEKILKIALIHDIPESRTGDQNYLQRQYVKKNESLALKDITNGLKNQKEMIKLWHEYKSLKSIESKIVHDADNLEVDFELKEQEAQGYRIPEEWKKIRKHVKENKLFTASAKKIWNQLQKHNPHLWHTKSRNRYLKGDWKY